MKRRAQATLEFTFVFVIIIALISSLFVMWKWSTDNIVKRQEWYNGSRVGAGSIDTPGEPEAQATVQPLTDTNMVYPENR
ncbi:MAG: hypothetical protein ABSE81_07085 [Candidatus Omnitrophota bacterium]|jgi:hypothetical protein